MKVTYENNIEYKVLQLIEQTPHSDYLVLSKDILGNIKKLETV